MMTKSGSERTALVIDNDLTFIRSGWFFDRVIYNDEGVEWSPYLNFVNEQKPDWKGFACYNEYYIDGKWNRRTNALGAIGE